MGETFRISIAADCHLNLLGLCGSDMSGNLHCILRRLNLTKGAGQLLERRSTGLLASVKQSNFANDVTVTAAPVAVKKEAISKAMKAYLERAQEHDKFMKAQTLEYQIGKRHLANMMGEDPETFTQEDVDRAIEYLFPSGIYDKKARPMMKPPEEIFPARKAAEFDETGRPFHPMFYTSKPNFFKLLYDIVEEMNTLYSFEERMNRKGAKPDPNLKLDLIGYEWLSKEKLEDRLVEKIADIEYTNFVSAMERLLSIPFSYKAKEFIDKYRVPLIAQTTVDEVPKPQYDEKGVAYVTTYECQRKSAYADVTVRCPGTGKITINGEDLTYFVHVQSREQDRFTLPPCFLSDLPRTENHNFGRTEPLNEQMIFNLYGERFQRPSLGSASSLVYIVGLN
ncbi:unnamed protein product [Hermetia illucens]|uniref:28S ribosomal protein S9, mitochondrial n=1 Tax=Hermetia illucens TaxID=343691 RepID=A0A7R8Z186_HERIL|nr:unnamed protein product [Hermetia illucens]